MTRQQILTIVTRICVFIIAINTVIQRMFVKLSTDTISVNVIVDSS